MTPIRVIGFKAASVLPDSVVSAQSGWQCTSWTLQADVNARDDRKKPEDATAIGTWLGQAKNVHLSSAGLDVAGRYSVLACKQ
jgi:hypothetical protein